MANGHRDRYDAAPTILKASTHGAAQKSGTEESKQRGNETTQHDCSAHHPETHG